MVSYCQMANERIFMANTNSRSNGHGMMTGPLIGRNEAFMSKLAYLWRMAMSPRAKPLPTISVVMTTQHGWNGHTAQEGKISVTFNWILLLTYLSEMSAPHQVRRELLEMLGLSGECLRLLEDNITPSLYTSPGVQCQLQANAAYSVMRSDYETDDVD